jgi:hypothetical protein
MSGDQNDSHEPDSLAWALAGMPEVWQRLLAEHTPDRYGRCVACASSRNAGTLWPCTLQVTATDARAICLGDAADHEADAADHDAADHEADADHHEADAAHHEADAAHHAGAASPPRPDTPCGAAC